MTIVQKLGWDGMGWDGMEWDGMVWDGMVWDGMGWDWMRGFHVDHMATGNASLVASVLSLEPCQDI